MNEVDFLEMINENQGIIYKICNLYRDSREDRQDLFQEVVFQLWRSYQSFNGSSKVSTWLYRVALNTAMASFRKNRPNVSLAAHLPDVQFENMDDQENELQERLIGCIKELAEADRALITMYLDELKYKEIASILGISENSVGVKLTRIKIRLQKLMN